MAAPQIASLPPSFVLASGMQVVVTAIDATTGATVANVSISSVSISVDQADTSAGSSTGAPPILVPTDSGI